MSLNSPSSVLAARSRTSRNPVSMANDVTDKLTDTRILANASGEYDILSGLKFRTSVGTDLSNRGRDTYYPRTTLMGSQVNGQAVRGTTQTTNFLNENTLSYNHQFGADQRDRRRGRLQPAAERPDEQHDQEQQLRDRRRRLRVDRRGHADRRTATSSSGHTRWTLASYLGRLNYTFLNRYLFTVTGASRRLVALRRRSPVGRLPVGGIRLARDGRAVHGALPGDRAAQVPRLDRHRGQPVDSSVSIDGAPAAAAVHVRRHGRPGLLPGVGREPEPRLGIDEAGRLRRRPRRSGAARSASPATSIARRRTICSSP